MKSEAHRKSIVEHLASLTDDEFDSIATEARHDKSDAAKASKERAAEAIRRFR